MLLLVPVMLRIGVGTCVSRDGPAAGGTTADVAGGTTADVADDLLEGPGLLLTGGG